MIISEWAVEVADASFLKWFICTIKLWLVSAKSTLCRHWNGNPRFSLFNFTFGIDEICFFFFNEVSFPITPIEPLFSFPLVAFGEQILLLGFAC